ncbi:hypothetical protein PR048_008318 [Dryococelus australis]|uniref:Uncharacterized protein n=1 Tax=Dryococelus australis TaxID=614101 RepID=A0ABQ9HWS2_9NEOP|nr:hypothetical protein PR048_008318 [Dryococelus australis]
MPIGLPLRRTNATVDLGQFTFRAIAQLDSPLRWQLTITPLSKSDSSVPRAISLSTGSTPACSVWRPHKSSDVRLVKRRNERVGGPEIPEKTSRPAASSGMTPHTTIRGNRTRFVLVRCEWSTQNTAAAPIIISNSKIFIEKTLWFMLHDTGLQMPGDERKASGRLYSTTDAVSNCGNVSAVCDMLSLSLSLSLGSWEPVHDSPPSTLSMSAWEAWRRSDGSCDLGFGYSEQNLGSGRVNKGPRFGKLRREHSRRTPPASRIPSPDRRRVKYGHGRTRRLRGVTWVVVVEDRSAAGTARQGGKSRFHRVADIPAVIHVAAPAACADLCRPMTGDSRCPSSSTFRQGQRAHRSPAIRQNPIVEETEDFQENPPPNDNAPHISCMQKFCTTQWELEPFFILVKCELSDHCTTHKSDSDLFQGAASLPRISFSSGLIKRERIPQCGRLELAPTSLPRAVIGDPTRPPHFLERCARGCLSPFWESHECRQWRDLLASQTSSRLLEFPIRLATMQECSGETGWRLSPPWRPKTLYILQQPNGRQSLTEAAWRVCASEVKCGRLLEIAGRRPVRCLWLEWTRGCETDEPPQHGHQAHLTSHHLTSACEATSDRWCMAPHFTRGLSSCCGYEEQFDTNTATPETLAHPRRKP